MFGYRSNFKTKRLMKQIVQANQETNLYGVQPLRKKAYQVIKDYNGWWESLELICQELGSDTERHST